MSRKPGDTRSSQEIDVQKQAARDERKRPETDAMLKSILGLEGVTNGKTPEYRMRHEFTFEWTEAMKHAANELMDAGESFEVAFERVRDAFARR